MRGNNFLAPAFVLIWLTLLSGCPYRFGQGLERSPFPDDIRRIEIRSAVNNTTVTGIETELTNDLRTEFALGSQVKLVRSEGDAILSTVIYTYEDVPSAYKADGKELTRTGTLNVACRFERATENKVLRKLNLSSSYTYLVSDSVSATLTNRRNAISKMIKDLAARIHRALFDAF